MNFMCDLKSGSNIFISHQILGYVPLERLEDEVCVPSVVDVISLGEVKSLLISS